MNQHFSNSWYHKKMPLVQPNTLEIFKAFKEMLFFFSAAVQPKEFLVTWKDNAPQPSKQCWGPLHTAGTLLVTGTLWALRQLTLPDRELRDWMDCSGGKWPVDTSGYSRMSVFKFWSVLLQSGYDYYSQGNITSKIHTVSKMRASFCLSCSFVEAPEFYHHHHNSVLRQYLTHIIQSLCGKVVTAFCYKKNPCKQSQEKKKGNYYTTSFTSFRP